MKILFFLVIGFTLGCLACKFMAFRREINERIDGIFQDEIKRREPQEENFVYPGVSLLPNSVVSKILCGPVRPRIICIIKGEKS